MKQVFYLRSQNILQNLFGFLSGLDLGKGWEVIIKPATRSLEQNAAQWPLLEAFSQQLEWPVNGRMTKMAPEEWKDVLTAAFRQEQPRVAMSLDGRGVVLLGQRTSQFNKTEFSDWLEFLHAIAAERGVNINRGAT